MAFPWTYETKGCANPSFVALNLAHWSNAEVPNREKRTAFFPLDRGGACRSIRFSIQLGISADAPQRDSRRRSLPGGGLAAGRVRRALSRGPLLGIENAYKSCDYLCMRTTLELDPDLLERAMRESGAPTKTAAVRLGLEALIDAAARRRLRALRGKIPDARAPRRHRPAAGQRSR